MKHNLSIITLLCINLIELKAQADIEKRLQTQLIMVENGSEVEMTEGVFNISKSLSLEGKKNVVIKGQGMGKTILSFKNQTNTRL